MITKNGKNAEKLIEELHHPNRDIRMQAAQTLGDLQNTRCVPVLCELLLNDRDEWVRIDAAEALGKIKDTRSVPALVVALKCEQLIAKWEQAWKEASSMQDDQKRSNQQFFLWGSLTAEISDIRAAAAHALGMIGGSEAVNALREALEEKHDINVCQAAEIALRNLGTPEALTALKNRQQSESEE